MGGAIFMITYGNNSDSGNHDVWSQFGGSIMFFLNCSATVLYLILGFPAQRKYPSSTISGYSYIIASFLMVITAIVVASSVLQPLTSTVASELLLLFNVVPNCDDLANGS